MFDQLKAMMEMKKKMEAVKAELDAAVFETASSDGSVAITMNGSMEVKGVRLGPGEIKDKEALQKAFKDTANRALKRCQEMATQKMQQATGLRLPGL